MPPASRDVARAFATGAAVALLNASLSFQNLWPTPAIRWEGELSVELAACLLLLLAARRWLGTPSRGAIRWLAAGAMTLVGILHFVQPDGFVKIVPAWLPAPRAAAHAATNTTRRLI